MKDKGNEGQQPWRILETMLFILGQGNSLALLGPHEASIVK